MKNCGLKIHVLVGEELFMKTLSKISRVWLRGYSYRSKRIGNLGLDTIQAWGEAFETRKYLYPHIYGTYMKLRAKSYIKFPGIQYDKRRVPIFLGPISLKEKQFVAEFLDDQAKYEDFEGSFQLLNSTNNKNNHFDDNKDNNNNLSEESKELDSNNSFHQLHQKSKIDTNNERIYQSDNLYESKVQQPINQIRDGGLSKNQDKISSSSTIHRSTINNNSPFFYSNDLLDQDIGVAPDIFSLHPFLPLTDDQIDLKNMMVNLTKTKEFDPFDLNQLHGENKFNTTAGIKTEALFENFLNDDSDEEYKRDWIDNCSSQSLDLSELDKLCSINDYQDISRNFPSREFDKNYLDGIAINNRDEFPCDKYILRHRNFQNQEHNNIDEEDNLQSLNEFKQIDYTNMNSSRPLSPFRIRSPSNNIVRSPISQTQGGEEENRICTVDYPKKALPSNEYHHNQRQNVYNNLHSSDKKNQVIYYGTHRVIKRDN